LGRVFALARDHVIATVNQFRLPFRKRLLLHPRTTGVKFLHQTRIKPVPNFQTSSPNHARIPCSDPLCRDFSSSKPSVLCRGRGSRRIPHSNCCPDDSTGCSDGDHGRHFFSTLVLNWFPGRMQCYSLRLHLGSNSLSTSSGSFHQVL